MAVQAVKNVPVQVHYYGKRDSTVTVEVVLQLELPLKAASAATSTTTQIHSVQFTFLFFARDTVQRA